MIIYGKIKRLMKGRPGLEFDGIGAIVNHYATSTFLIR